MLDDIGYRAEVLIPLAQVRICKVKVCFFCDRYAGVAQYSAQGIYVHSVHQAALSEVISEAVGRILAFDGNTSQIASEVLFKGAYGDVLAVVFHREAVIAFHISVLVVYPAPQNGFGLGGEKHGSVLAAFCYFCA